jgi:hypothetical protein
LEAIDKHFDQMFEKINTSSSFEADPFQCEVLGKYLEIVHKNEGLAQLIQKERHAKIVETDHLMKVIAGLSIKAGIKYWFKNRFVK